MRSTGEEGRSSHPSVLVAARWGPGGDLRAALARVGVIGAWITAIALVLLWAAAAQFDIWTWFGFDSHAYWVATHVTHPYGRAPNTRDSFLYSPAFVQLVRPLAWMPWPAFYTTFAILNSAVFLWLTAPSPWRWRVPMLMVCATEVFTGNIAAFLALSLVIGVTRGEAVAFQGLTKILPGGVGLLWHVSRGDWRQVGRLALTTSVVIGLSFAVVPHLWIEWGRFLVLHAGSGPNDLPLRVLVAFVVTMYAARSNLPALLAVAVWLTLLDDGIGVIQGYTVLVAGVRLHRSRELVAARHAPNGAITTHPSALPQA